jgi:tetratricopeptide (TPR) repeat protein
MSKAQHPPPELLERFLRNDTEAAENRKVVRHLLAGCPECQKVTRALWVLGEDEIRQLRQKLVRPRPRRDPAAYGAVFDQVAAETFRQAGALAPAQRSAEARLAELLALAPADRLVRLLADSSWGSVPLAEQLLAKLQEMLDIRDGAALPLAELGALLVEKLDPRAAGRTLTQALRSRAWALFAEARRQAGDLEGAGRALAGAEALCFGVGAIAEGPAATPVEAEICYFRARLAIDQMRFAEAGADLARAIEIHRRTGDTVALCRAIILEGALCNWMGDDDGARERLGEGLALLDRRTEPRLTAEALYRLVPLAEDPAEALRLLTQSRELYEQAGDPSNLIRLRRLEGKVEETLGHFAAAEAHLSEARKGFLQAGLGREAAQTSLDLALLYVHQGKTLDIHQLARWTFPVFSSKSVQKETIYALLVLQWEAESDRINPEFIGEIARYLDPAPRPGRSGLSAVH